MSSNKYLVFISTLLGYSVVHIQRMTLPFVQLNLMNFFNIHKLQMGIANATLYIILGLSYLWIALRPIKNPQFTYLWTMTISSLFFLVTPLLVYLHLPIPAVFYLSLAAFGLFQSPAWPIMLQIIHIYFRPRQDGCILGLWSANGDIGNILGFIMCTIIAYQWMKPFQICLIIAGILGILVSINIYNLKINNPQQNHQIKQISQQKSYTQNILNQYKQILKDKQVSLMLLMFCMLKSIIYGMLLWLPMYFQTSGFGQFEGIIPITMNIMAILGSIALGTIYQKISSKAMRSTIFMLILILTVICFYLMRHVQFTLQNKFVLLLVIGFIGFCVMGNYNILATHQISAVSQKKKISITAFSSLAMAMGSIIVGIFQFIIGQTATQDSNSVFLVFFIISILIVILQIIRTIFLWRYRSQHEHQLQQHLHNQDKLISLNPQQSQYKQNNNYNQKQKQEDQPISQL